MAKNRVHYRRESLSEKLYHLVRQQYVDRLRRKCREHFHAAANDDSLHTPWKSYLAVREQQVVYDQQELDYIPEEGPLVIVSNHPLGLDDIAIMAAIGQRRSDVKLIANQDVIDIMGEEVYPYVFGINNYDREKVRQTVEDITSYVADGGAVVNFPFRAVSGYDLSTGRTVEGQWKSSIPARLLQNAGAQCVPCYIANSYSPLTYRAIELSKVTGLSRFFGVVAALVEDTVSDRNRKINVNCGKPVNIGDIGLNPDKLEITEFLRHKTFDLQS